jgi:DNA-binding NarL/FixJ family response regulator
MSASGHLPSPVRVLLIDASEIFRRGVKSVLSAADDRPIQVVGEAGTVAEGLAACRRLRPDVVLIDLLPPEDTAPPALRQVSGYARYSRLLVLTSHASDALVYEAVTAGARGFLLKDVAPSVLVQAVREIAAGRSILDPETTARLMRMLRRGPGPGQTGGLETLSNQERRVLTCVAEGMTNKQAARRLGLSENTVKNYLAHVFEKLAVKRRSQAAALLVRQTGPQP